MKSISIDESRWPLVVVRIVGTPTDAELDVMLRRSSEQLRGAGKQVTIVDLTRAANAPAVQRRKHANWLQENAERLRMKSAGTALVIDNALIRGIFTAIVWLQPLPMDHIVVATVAEAELWARAQLRKHGAAPLTVD